VKLCKQNLPIYVVLLSLHTMKYWKAAMLYHQTKGFLFVKQFLGHKSIENTELYI